MNAERSDGEPVREADGRASFSDPVTAAADLPEQFSVAAADGVPSAPSRDPEPLFEQPSDQGGFGAHRLAESRGTGGDEKGGAGT